MSGQLNQDDFLKLVYNDVKKVINAIPGLISRLAFKKVTTNNKPDLYEPLNKDSNDLLTRSRAFAIAHGLGVFSDTEIESVAEEAYIQLINDLGLVKQTEHIPTTEPLPTPD